jgi:Ribonuclease G/E
MAERHIYIDAAPGETRGVVTLDGRPERLVIERAGEPFARLGARYQARVTRIDKGLGLALLNLGAHAGALRLKPDRAPPVEGQTLQVEVAIEPQGDKAAVVRAIDPEAGDAPAQSLEDRLAKFAPAASISRGLKARPIADEAEDEALAIDHLLPGGGAMAIEITRALTAVDVDLGAGGGRDPKRAARQANLNAIAALGRLLRLKALGGLVVIDLVGRGHDGQALTQAVQAAFAPDQPGVAVGPISKFGALELALPRRYRPVRDILCGGSDRPTVQTLGLRLLRAMETQGRADPGGRIVGRAAPGVAEAAAAQADALANVIGARFEILADPALARDRLEATSR